MSFYGDIKRVQSSPYVFDKIYPNRLAMEQNAVSDGVYIGRYVLVKYTCKYENDTLVDFNKYVSDPDNPPDGKMISQDYNNNANADIGVYKDTFDGTVWQKIYTNITTNNEETIKEKYILISELNAAIPRLELVEPHPMPKYIDTTGEHWRGITIDESASSEDVYKISIPEILQLEVGESGNLFDETLLDPKTRSSAADQPIGDGVDGQPASMFDSNNNYMKWKSFLGENTNITSGDIQGKKLETKLNGLGQAISDIYDALFGVPSSGSGARPFFTDDISSVLGQKDKGLVGVLSAITMDIKGDGSEDYANRSYQPGAYYYFISKWGDATEDPDNFIENIPRVIGSSTEYSDLKAHYKINDWALSTPQNV